jgi:hypothetical protein
MTDDEMIDAAEANIRADYRAGKISKEQFQKELLIVARARQQAPAPAENVVGSEPVQDQWFLDRNLPIMAVSGDAESDCVLKLHFRRPVSDSDRKDLVEALNLYQVSLHNGTNTNANQIPYGFSRQEIVDMLSIVEAEEQTVDGGGEFGPQESTAGWYARLLREILKNAKDGDDAPKGVFADLRRDVAADMAVAREGVRISRERRKGSNDWSNDDLQREIKTLQAHGMDTFDATYHAVQNIAAKEGERWRFWREKVRILAAENIRLRAALSEIATTEEYRGLTAEEAMSVAQKALSAEVEG